MHKKCFFMQRFYVKNVVILRGATFMKRLLSVVMVAMLTVGLVACGKSTPTAVPSTPTPVPTQAGSDAPPDAPAADLGKIEDGAKLVYWTMWNEAEPQGTVIQEAVDAFTAETGVPVEINFNGRDIRKTLEPALAGGEVIDLFDEDIERVLNVWGDYLLPLDAYVDAAYDNTSGKPYRSVVNNTLITLANDLGAAKGFANGGKIHNIPFQPSTFVTM
jgi:ABC-type glycerol-3-phosphate transport system substrate-binding protein